jgi:hypothetical protein
MTTAPPPESYTCPRCRNVSRNADDIANGYCGNCHEFTRISLRMRLFVAGHMTADVWVHSTEGVELLGAEHQRLAMEAQARGELWLVEVYDPQAPPGLGYLRFGTDRFGMVEPSEVSEWPWQ